MKREKLQGGRNIFQEEHQCSLARCRARSALRLTGLSSWNEDWFPHICCRMFRKNSWHLISMPSQVFVHSLGAAPIVRLQKRPKIAEPVLPKAGYFHLPLFRLAFR